MGTLIHAVAHGLVASDTIMLGNLVGGTGLSENTLYYVLAAGLTADDFSVSLTDGGAAITFTTDITDGVVVRSDEYTVVSDGVMDPPSALGTPDPPVLTSTEVAGLVRLYVEVPGYTDSAVRVRLTEVTVTHRYDGVTPLWESATTLAIPQGVTSMSIPALGSTKYAARSRVQDVFGNYSSYSTVAELTTDAGVDARGVIDGAITETKIADGAISTPKLQAGSITAATLAATIVLASLLKTAESGRRIELDVDGIRLFDTDESLLVRIPTNGDPVYVKGQVNADTLISQTAATFRTAASLEGNAVMTLQNGIATPSNVPALTASVDYLALTSTPSGVSTAAGIAYDSAAGTFWLACDPTVSPYYVAQEFNATTGALVRSIAATGSTTTVTTTLGSTSHVSDTAQAYSGNTNSHIATPLTMPRAGRITKVSAYLAGYGGDATCRNSIWSDVSGTGVLLRESASYTAANAAFSTGNSSKYDKTLTSPLTVSSGQVIYAGFRHTSSADGFQYDRDDGSGKTTYGGDTASDPDGTGWGSLTSSSKPNVYITYEYDVDTRLETAPNIGIATDGTHIYTLDNTGVVWKYLRSDGSYVAKSSVQTGITGTKAKAGLFYDATAVELIITTTTGTGAGVYPRFVRVSPGTLAVSTAFYDAAAGTTFSGSTDTFRGGARLPDPLNANAATYWVTTTSTVYAYTYATTVATQTANRDFGTAASSGDGLTHDGTVFRGWDSASSTKVWKFSAWDWTTASAVYWIGYSWYDSAGTTHETACGPRASITMRRRERVQVQNATIPTGGVDDPNSVRIYMLPGASDFTAGTGWLQVTDSLASRHVVTYTGSGTNDGAGTPFASGTPAELKSSATGWTLKGSGAINRTGTAFPASPATGDHFYRSDIGMEFFYNGTRWLSTALYIKDLPPLTSSALMPLTATGTQGFSPVPKSPGSDIWLEDLVTNFYISGGTALGASHKWVGVCQKRPSDNSTTTLATITIASGLSSVWRQDEQAIDALLNNGTTHYALSTVWTMTGTPGGLYPAQYITYRIVAT